MIADVRDRLDSLLCRQLRPRALPDIVDFLEGRTMDIDGNPVGPLQLVDKDDPYRGPFTTENCPDIREILRSCVSNATRRTVIVGPTQSFKTTILIGVEAYTIAADPGPIGHVLPAEPLARAFSSKRFQLIVENTPWLAALKPKNPDLYKVLELGFTTCTVRFAGSNSPGNLASWPYRRVIGDETDKFPQRLKNEAGTRELLQQRTGQFTHFNHIDASTPTVPWATIWQAALVGDCRRYYVPCPHCAKLFTHRFTTDGSTLVWDKDAKNANGTWDLERVARSAHYRCPHCSGEIWENHRRDMLHAGQWIPDSKDEADQRRADYELVADPTCRSYFRSCFNVLHPNRTYAAIAVKHLLAGRDPSKRQNFTNSELGEVHEEHGDTVEWEVLQKRAEDYLTEDAPNLLPPGVLFLTAGVDKQESPARLEYEIIGWGEDFESWGIEYGVIEKRGGTWRSAWDELDRRTQRVWDLPIRPGVTCPLTPAAVCVDTGHDPEDCYDYVRRCQPRRVYAVKGSSEGYGQPLVERPRKSGVKKVALWMVGTVTAKAEIYSRLRIVEDGPGKMHFPKNPKRGYDGEWFRQLVAEKCVTRTMGGRKVLKFIKPSGRRNEALDIRCYARAAHHLLNPSVAKIKAMIQASAPDDEKEEAEQEAPAPVSAPAAPVAEMDLAGRITPAAPEAPPAAVPNTYAPAATDARPVARKAFVPRRGSWATRW